MRLLKEPFVHFLLIGAIVFAFSFFRESENKIDNDDCQTKTDTQIVVTTEMVESLYPHTAEDNIESTEFVTQRKKAIAQHIQDEILFREAIARNLERTDPVVRSRLVKKMKVIASEQASLEPISETEILAFYQDNIETFSWPARVSIAQAYFDNKKRANNAESDCDSAWRRVQSNRSISPDELSKLGDSEHGMRPQMHFLTEKRLKQLFGQKIAKKLLSLNKTGWLPPMKGETGWHLFQVTAVYPKGVSPIENVRAKIEKQLEIQRNNRAIENFLLILKGKYQAVIE